MIWFSLVKASLGTWSCKGRLEELEMASSGQDQDCGEGRLPGEASPIAVSGFHSAWAEASEHRLLVKELSREGRPGFVLHLLGMC